MVAKPDKKTATRSSLTWSICRLIQKVQKYGEHDITGRQYYSTPTANKHNLKSAHIESVNPKTEIIYNWTHAWWLAALKHGNNEIQETEYMMNYILFGRMPAIFLFLWDPSEKCILFLYMLKSWSTNLTELSLLIGVGNGLSLDRYLNQRWLLINHTPSNIPWWKNDRSYTTSLIKPHWTLSSVMWLHTHDHGCRWFGATMVLCMRPAYERRRYNITSSLIGWVHIQTRYENNLYSINH